MAAVAGRFAATSASPQARSTSVSLPRLMATDVLAGPFSAIYARAIESTRAATTALAGG